MEGITTANFELHSCFAWVSDFSATKQYCDGCRSPASSNQPLQSLPNNNIIETTTPPQVVYIIVMLPFHFF